MEVYIKPLLGGCLIGLGSLVAMAASGRIPGISGVVAKVIAPKKGDVLWRILFLVGLIAGAFIIFQAAPESRSFALPGGRGLAAIVIAAFLVGFGARVGGGCTSGHGVCGIGAGAKDAVLYTCVFMATGAVTVLIWNLIVQGGLAG